MQRGYLDTDPLQGIARFDTTPKTKRRAMTPDDIRKVLRVAPEHRRILYEVAFTTGLRAGELRALTPESIDTERGALILDPAWTKNRKPGLQPIPHALVGKLVAFGEAGTAKALYERHHGRKDARPKDIPKKPLFSVPIHTARDFRKDLQAAGVADFKHGEGKLDFHALRVAYVTFVLEAGATVKEGQTLARHATPDLTMNVYARVRNERLAELAEKMGEVVLSEPDRALCVHTPRLATDNSSHNDVHGKALRPVEVGGGYGARTRDLDNAIVALSQLS